MNDFDKLKDILSREFGTEPDTVKASDHLVKDLMLDSIDLVELIMNVEEEFGIDIPDVEAEKLETVQDVLTYIEENQE